MDSGAEMFRITGTARGRRLFENGISRLSPRWEPIIEQLLQGLLRGGLHRKKSPAEKPPCGKQNSPPTAPKKRLSAYKDLSSLSGT